MILNFDNHIFSPSDTVVITPQFTLNSATVSDNQLLTQKLAVYCDGEETEWSWQNSQQTGTEYCNFGDV